MRGESDEVKRPFLLGMLLGLFLASPLAAVLTALGLAFIVEVKREKR